MSKTVLPMFSSKNFIVSGLTFRSLILFEFILVYGVGECSNFILFHVAVQFSQHHLLKRLSFLHCIFLPPLSKEVTICAWVYLWAFYPVALIYISFFAPVLYCLDIVALLYSLKSGSLIPPALFFFLKIALAIRGLLCFLTNCEIFRSSSVKNAIGSLIGIWHFFQIAILQTQS